MPPTQSPAASLPRFVLTASIAALLVHSAPGADVLLTSTDAVGTTSFNTGTRWSDGQAPFAGNNYFTQNFALRTPSVTGDFTFGGDTLTVQTGGGVAFKGLGIVTVNDLRLDGGGLLHFSVQPPAGTPDDAKLAGTLTVVSASTIDTTTNINRSFTISSLIRGSGALNVRGTTGVVRFTNPANDWNGVLSVGSGPAMVLEVASIANGGLASGLGASTSNAANITLNGGTIRVTGTLGGSTDRLFTLAGNGNIESSASVPVSFTNTGDIAFIETGARTFTLGGTNTGANTFAPRIVDNPNVGATSFTKTGGGTWRLTAANTYSGATNVNGGVLVFTGFSELGTGTAINFGGGTLRWDTGNTLDITSRTITATAGTSSFDTNGQDITLAGVLTGSGIFRKTGSGRLSLPNANTFTGGFVLNNGVVSATNSNSLGSGTGQVTIEGNSGASGTLELSGGINIAKAFTLQARQAATLDAIHIANISGSNTISGQTNLTTGGSDYNIESRGGFLLLSGGINGSTLASGLRRVKFSGDGDGQVNGITGNGTAIDLPIVKSGAGTWTIAGPSSYSGTTTVNGGTLVTNTGATGSGAVTVADNAGFGVRVLQAGQSYTTSSLTIGSASGGTLSFDLGTSGNPTAAVITSPSFTTSGTVAINIAGSNLAIGQFKLIDYDTFTGDFANLSLGARPPRLTASLVSNTADTSIDLNITGFDFPRWTGATNGNWDVNDGTGTGTVNWREVKSDTPTRFLQGAAGIDSALFDDTASGTGTVNLTTTLTPTSVLVNNDAKAYTFTGTGKLSGSTGLTKGGPGSLTIANTGGNDFTGNAAINGGTVQLGDGATAGAGDLGNVNIAVAPGASLVLNRPDDFTLTNVLSGAGTVSKVATNTVTLTGNNSNFTGALNVTAGTVKLGATTALGGAAGTTAISNAGTLDVNGLIVPVGKVVTVSGPGVDGNGAIVNSVANATIPGLKNLTLAGNTTIGGTQRWDIRDNAGGLNAAGFALTKKGVNIIVLKSLGETNLGTVNIESGTLGFEGDTTMGSAPGVVNVATGAQLLFFNNTAVNSKELAVNGGTLAASSGALNRVDGKVSLTNAAAVDIAANTTLNLAGAVEGTGSLTKINPGTLVLSGSTAFTGGLTVNAGVLNNTATGNYAGGSTIATGVTVNIGQGGINGGLGTGPVANNGTLNINRTDTNLVIPGEISGAGALNIGAGVAANFDSVVTLSGNNTFTSTVNIPGGGLRITQSNGLGLGTKTVGLNNGTAGRPNLRLASDAVPIVVPADISFLTSNNNGNGAIVNESGNNTIRGNVTLTSGGGDTGISVLDGTLTLEGTFVPNTSNRGLVLRGAGNGFFNGALNDSGNPVRLIKDGTGTWAMNGSSAYTGTTTVNAGTLLVNGSISGSQVRVNATATLGGRGTITTPAFDLISGSKLSPGDGVGTLTVDAGTAFLNVSSAIEPLASGALLYQLGTPEGSDRFAITNGTLNIGVGFLELDDFGISPGSAFGPGSYVLFDGISPILGELGTGITGQIGGYDVRLELVDLGSDLVLTVIPEPGSATLLLAGLGSVLGVRRLRRGRRE